MCMRTEHRQNIGESTPLIILPNEHQTVKQYKKIKVRTTNDDDGQNIASLDPNQHEIWKCKWEKARLIRQWKERNNALFRKALTFLDRMLEVVACGN